MNTSISLIPTKLLPPSPIEPALARKQLVQKLHEMTEKKLSIVCAGAGYGKTELVSTFVSESSHKTVWYTIDDYDNDEIVFASHLIAGLQQICPNITTTTIRPYNFSRHEIISQLITELQTCSEPIIIVLDNFQDIEQLSPTSTFIDLLLNYAPPQLHIVLTTRSMPTLSQLSRLHSRGDVATLMANDLAFEATEIQDLFTLRYNRTLSLSIAEQLKEHTFGWPLSVHFTLKSLGQGNETLSADETSQQLTSYIKSEILAKHPDRIKNFLLDTAIFEQFTPALAEMVLEYENSQGLISYLQQHNLLLTPVVDQPEVYTYSPHVRALLQQDFLNNDRTKFIASNRRVAHHFEERGLLQEALEHYQKAEDWDATIRLLEGLTEEMLNGQHLDKLQGWLQCLAPKSQTMHPKFLLYRAQLQARVGQPQEALALLGEARRALGQTHQPHYEMLMLAQMGLIHIQQGDYSTARRLLEQAQHISTKDTRLSPDLDLLSSSLTAVTNSIPDAIKQSQKALYQYEIQTDLYGQAQTMITIAGLAIDLGQMSKAGTLLTQSAEIGRQLASPAYLDILNTTMAARRFWLAGDLAQAKQILTAHESLVQEQVISSLFSVRFLQTTGVVHRDEGEFAQAETYLKEALNIAMEQHAWALKPGIIEDLAWLHFRQGNLDAACKLAQQARTLINDENSRQAAQIHTLLGILAREQGQLHDALFHLETAQKAFEALGFKLGLWSNQLHLAQSYFELGYQQQGIEQLRQALSFARENSLKGAYFWNPNLVARLCVVAIAEDIETRYATCLAAELSNYLELEDILTLKELDDPRADLACIHLLKAVGTAEAQRQLHSYAAKAASPQIKQQAKRALSQLTDQQQDTPRVPEIKIHCLGNLLVERDGQPIEGQSWAGKSKAGRQKVKTLLAYLVERGSHGATKDELIEALWGSKAWGRDETKLESSLARTLSALRQVLEPDLVAPAPSSFVLNEDGRYYLNSNQCWVDAQEFQRLIKEARTAKMQDEPGIARAAYVEALALYRDEYFRDIPGAEEWAGLQRYALSQQLGIALMSVGGYYLEDGITKEALTCYQRAIVLEPTNHTAHYRFIDTLRQEGRYEDAVLAYQRCRKIFQQEVDEEPPEILVELHDNIQAQLVSTPKSKKQKNQTSVSLR